MIHTKIKSKVKINISTKCKICNKKLKSISGLASHIKNQHNLSYSDYLLDFFNINLIKINKEFDEEKEKNRKSNRQKQMSGIKKYTDSIKGKTRKEILGDKYDNFIKNMQGVFSIDWFIKKYGEKEGRKKYKERSKKISKTSYFKIYNKINKNNYSKISQEVFWELYKIIKHKFDKIYFAELNHEYSCVSKKNYDFVIIDNKKVIEFNGDKFHANPKLYNENDIPLKFLDKSAGNIWKEDNIKINKAIKKGFNVKVIWEKDYLENKDKVILECLNFIFNL